MLSCGPVFGGNGLGEYGLVAGGGGPMLPAGVDALPALELTCDLLS